MADISSATQTRPGRNSASVSMVGSKIQRLRRRCGLSQAGLAKKLGISASYLNLIEHGRRKLTVSLLLQLAELFDLKLTDLADDDHSQLLADLMEVFGDDLFAAHPLKNTDVQDLVASNPGVARAVLHLHDACRNLRADLNSLTEQLDKRTTPQVSSAANRLPAEQVSDFIQANSNHFSTLEQAAERVGADIPLDSGGVFFGMSAFLTNVFGVNVVMTPAGPEQTTLRRYDEATQTLQISQLLPPDSQNFQIANQIGLLAARDEIEHWVDEASHLDDDARVLARIALANYFAAALLMPYEPFHERAIALRYDLDLLSHHFAASFEQICHRLTTLQRPGARGIPFHMLRVDIAGNISKQFSLSGIHIPRHGAACPRWNVYTAFLQPGTINVQVSQLPDGAAYLCMARTVLKGVGGHNTPQHFMSVGIGCEISHARQMVYADGLHLDDFDAAVPIGGSCRTCPRLDCQHRAFPPVTHKLTLNENIRSQSAYFAPS